jgi:hypothetical protein
MTVYDQDRQRDAVSIIAELRQQNAELLAALKEIICWVPNGSGMSAERRGAQCGTRAEAFALARAAIQGAVPRG